jgi:PAS domain S-box-containing protein
MSVTCDARRIKHTAAAVSKCVSANFVPLADLLRGSQDVPLNNTGICLILCTSFTAANIEAAVIINDSHLHDASTLARILETQMAAIITINQRQEIVLINPAAEEMFGYARNALLNKHISVLIPARFHAIHGSHIEQFGATGTTSRRMGDASNVVAVREDGTEFPIEAFISHVAEQGEHFFTVIMRDITARKFIEAELQKSHDEMRALSKRLVEVRELEGKRIARELHDELGQVLAAIRIDLTLLREELPAASLALQKTAQGIDDLLVEARSRRCRFTRAISRHATRFAAKCTHRRPSRRCRSLLRQTFFA